MVYPCLLNLLRINYRALAHFPGKWLWFERLCINYVLNYFLNLPKITKMIIIFDLPKLIFRATILDLPKVSTLVINFDLPEVRKMTSLIFFFFLRKLRMFISPVTELRRTTNTKFEEQVHLLERTLQDVGTTLPDNHVPVTNLHFST